MMGAAAVIAFVAFSTEPVSSATATVGVFLAGGFRMLAPLNKVIFAISQTRASMPSLEQLADDLNMAKAEDVAENLQQTEEVHLSELRPRLSLRDVTFSYVPGVPVLDHVTFDIDQGEAIGLVGGSGAGKSTLVDVLLGLLETDSGEVLVDGWPIHSVRRQWQSMVGYVPQSIVLFDATVRANVAFGVADGRRRRRTRLAGARARAAHRRGAPAAVAARRHDRGGRGPALGWAAPTVGRGACALPRAPDPDVRRGDLGARQRDRVQAHRGARELQGEAHHRHRSRTG